MKKILLVRLSSLGDVVHTFPAVTDVARHMAGAELHWAVDADFAELPALHTGVARVIPVPLRRIRRPPFDPAVWRAFAEVPATLRATQYDTILDLQGLLKTALVALLARGPHHGHAATTAREWFAALFYQHRHRAPRSGHPVIQLRSLAAATFGYVMDGPIDYGLRVPPPPPFQPKRAHAVLLHSTSRPAKLWDEDKWILLGRRIERAGVLCVLPWGRAFEHERAKRLARGLDQALVAPVMTLTEAAGLLAPANVVVGLDTGLTHLAAAVRTPVVGIYTSTSPTDVRPIGLGATAACGEIGAPPSVDEVIAAIERVAPGLI